MPASRKSRVRLSADSADEGSERLSVCRVQSKPETWSFQVEESSDEEDHEEDEDVRISFRNSPSSPRSSKGSNSRPLSPRSPRSSDLRGRPSSPRSPRSSRGSASASITTGVLRGSRNSSKIETGGSQSLGLARVGSQSSVLQGAESGAVDTQGGSAEAKGLRISSAVFVDTSEASDAKRNSPSVVELAAKKQVCLSLPLQDRKSSLDSEGGSGTGDVKSASDSFLKNAKRRQSVSADPYRRRQSMFGSGTKSMKDRRKSIAPKLSLLSGEQGQEDLTQFRDRRKSLASGLIRNSVQTQQRVSASATVSQDGRRKSVTFHAADDGKRTSVTFQQADDGRRKTVTFQAAAGQSSQKVAVIPDGSRKLASRRLRGVRMFEGNVQQDSIPED